MTTTWPLQKNCNAFYGNPRGSNGGPSAKWEAANLVSIKPPYRMTYDGKPLTSIRIHKLCADSLLRILNAIWEAAGRKQSVVDGWGASIYGGGYNFRLMRGGNSLSLHSWGCAIDLDPARNGLGDSTPHFAQVPEVRAAFAAEGWEWGGDWSRPDGMHWQAARTTAGAMKPVQPAPVPTVPDLSSKAVVRKVQQLLDDKGWHEVGTVDGEMGKRTEGAILAFRNEQEPRLLPLTPTIDGKLIAALEAASPRAVSMERATTTAADLKAQSEPTILTADNIKTVGLVTAGFAGVGGADQQGAIDKAKGALDGLGAIQELGDRALSLVQWTAQHWWIPVIVIGGIVIWKAQGVIRQRVADHRSGKNLAL